MAQPSTRNELKEYCLRQLGAPVLEINLADEQCQDLIDDALQFFNERHFDGVLNTYLKYKITQDDIDRGKAKPDVGPGITTTTATSTIDGSSVSFDWKENSNYLQVPPSVIGVNKVFHFDGANTLTNNMFSVKYQLFLNDVYYWGAVELLSYAMTKTYLSDIEFLLTTEKQIRFNQRMDRLYLDIDWESIIWDVIVDFDINPEDLIDYILSILGQPFNWDNFFSSQACEDDDAAIIGGLSTIGLEVGGCEEAIPYLIDQGYECDALLESHSLISGSEEMGESSH